MNRGFVYLLCDGEKFKIGMTRGKIDMKTANRMILSKREQLKTLILKIAWLEVVYYVSR